MEKASKDQNERTTYRVDRPEFRHPIDEPTDHRQILLAHVLQPIALVEPSLDQSTFLDQSRSLSSVERSF
jgi:hypothetical protein